MSLIKSKENRKIVDFINCFVNILKCFPNSWQFHPSASFHMTLTLQKLKCVSCRPVIWQDRSSLGKLKRNHFICKQDVISVLWDSHVQDWVGMTNAANVTFTSQLKGRKRTYISKNKPAFTFHEMNPSSYQPSKADDVSISSTWLTFKEIL